MNHDVVIVGSGVSGLLTAIILAEAGVRCCLLDKGPFGMESSWAGGGILSPLYPWNYPDDITALTTWSLQHYPDFFARLQHQTGIDPEWVSSGHLILDCDEISVPISQWAQASNNKVTVVDQNELAHIEPTLAGEFQNALWLAEIGQVRNPRLIKALSMRAKQLGVTCLENTPATSLTLAGHAVTGVRTPKENLSADKILIATGAWSSLPLGARIQLPDTEPVKGQMIQFQTRPGTIQRISLYQGHYLIPRQDGKILAGSTLEYTGYDKSIDSEAAEQLRLIAIQMYPVLKDQPIINHWAGLRPGNTRQVPYICPHPVIENLFFNTGHFRNGIVLGLASARLCADLILERAPILAPSPYAMEKI